MKCNPLISVIMPCHNSENFIIDSLKSLDNQTYKNVEFVVIDDGSSDNSLALLQNYAKSHPNYKIIHTEGVGVSTARNVGIDNACGEYITFLDSDDIVSPHHLQTLYDCLIENGAQLAICAYKKVREGKPYEKFKFKTPKYKAITYNKLEACMQFLAQRKFEYSVWNKLYSKKILDQYGIRFMDGCRYNEDSLFNYKYVKNIDKTVYMPFKTHFYVQRKKSLVHQKFNEFKLDAYKSLNNIVKDVHENYSELIHYAHTIRAYLSCEIIFYIKCSKYANGDVIRTIARYIKNDSKHLKYCKRLHLYRKWLIPLVPFVVNIFLCKRLKAKGNFTTPDAFNITDK